MGNSRLLAAALCVVCAAACGGEQKPVAEATATPRPTMQPLPDTAFSVEWGLPGVPSAVPAGGTFAVGVRVKNTGDQVWMDPRNSDATTYAAGAVRLSYRWWKAGNSSALYADYTAARGELLGPVMPGKATLVAIEVTAPTEPGDYRLQLDLLQELVSWFEPKGAAKLFVPVKVRAQAPAGSATGEPARGAR